jgi:hypothetical protein
LASISLERLFTSVLNDKNSKNFAKDEVYSYESIFLSRISPDSTNARYLPSIIISDSHAYQFVSRQLSKSQLVNIYQGQDKVLVGKSCIVNCLKYGTTEWKMANKTINSIIELAENVAVSEVIQAPTIYPTDAGDYRILTGHRRFYAMVYNDGVNGAAHFKVYASKPLLLKTKQFQENASREELPQHGKLLAFQDALREVEILNTSMLKLGHKALTIKEISNLLGVSMGAYDNYNVLTRYPAVIKAFENGISDPLLAVKKLVLNTEKAYKKRNNVSQLNVNDRNEINRLIEVYFAPDDKSVKKKELTGTGVQAYKLGSIESSFVIKMLLTKNVCEFDCGVDWDQVDWQNVSEMNEIFKKVVVHISETENSNKQNNS